MDTFSVYVYCVYFILQVEAVPTVLAMKNGKIVDKFVGLKDDDGLANFVNKLTGK